MAKFVAEKAHRELRILPKFGKLRELWKIAIFVNFVAERKIVKIVVVFNPGNKCKRVAVGAFALITAYLKAYSQRRATAVPGLFD